jgi:uncharacterized protein
MEQIHEGYNRWTWMALGLVSLTKLTAALGMQSHASRLDILLTGKFFDVLLAPITAWNKPASSHS